MKQYKVCKCPGCGMAQVTTSMKKLLCKFCARSSTIKGKKFGFNIIVLTSFDTAREAGEFLREYNKQLVDL